MRRWWALLGMAACAAPVSGGGPEVPSFVAPPGEPPPWPPGQRAAAAAPQGQAPPAPTTTARPAPPAPVASVERSSLAEALRHDWAGDYGSIEVEEGSAVVELRTCSIVPSANPSQCPAMKAEGMLKVKKWSFEVGAQELVAFVDDEGQLHVAKRGAVVGRLDEDRSGTVALSYFLSLTVGETCSARAGEQTSPVPCRFEERDGQTWLVATVAGVKRELIYLEGARILASPALVHQVFRRSSS